MTSKIVSTYLWDRLAFILGAEAGVLGPRPEKRKQSVFGLDRNDYEREVFAAARFADEQDRATVEAIVADIQKYVRGLLDGSALDPRHPYVVHGLYSVKFSYYEDSPERDKHDIEMRYSATSDREVVVGALKLWIFLQSGTPERYADLFSVHIREVETLPSPDSIDAPPVGRRLMFAWRADQTIFSFDSTALSEICQFLRKCRTSVKTVDDA
jgi:hypothetical protein